MNYSTQASPLKGSGAAAGDRRSHPQASFSTASTQSQQAPQQWWGVDAMLQPGGQRIPQGPPVSQGQQRQLRHNHHMSLPPYYYASQGSSPSPQVSQDQSPYAAMQTDAMPYTALDAAAVAPLAPSNAEGYAQGASAAFSPQVSQAGPQIMPQNVVPGIAQGPAGVAPQPPPPPAQAAAPPQLVPQMVAQNIASSVSQGVRPPPVAQAMPPSYQAFSVAPQPQAGSGLQVPVAQGTQAPAMAMSSLTMAPPPSMAPPPPPQPASALGGMSQQAPMAQQPTLTPLMTPTSQSPHPRQPPRIRRVQSWSQLKPVVVQHPKSRRAMPDGGFMSPLLALTSFLPSTYSICDPNFQYSQAKNPRRVLTEPYEAQLNNGYDNIDSDYILYVNDILGGDENRRYLALNLLGKGTFGQVVKCQNMATKEVVAVKVIKNKPAYLNQSMMEVSILEYIQQNVDKTDSHNLLRLKDKFMHKEHLCLVFELLSSNLYEVIKKKQFRGLDINVVRTFSRQLLDSLSVLKGARLIHCDLKPENILLKRNDDTAIKIIDFGSACHERQTVYTYIQSRFYRSPEVILGLPYTSAIDMWSLGCIVIELFLGLPIFPGSSEYNQWSRIVDSLGLPPRWMLDMGKNTNNFMVETPQREWRMRTIEEQNQTFKTNEKESKQYFSTTNIHDVIMSYPLPRTNMSKAEVDEEMRQREALSDFVLGLLNFNPFERWTPQQALMHPFISRQRFVGPFSPQPQSQQQQQQQQQLQMQTVLPGAGPMDSAAMQIDTTQLQTPSRYRNAQVLAQAQAQAQQQVQAMAQGQQPQQQQQAQAQPMPGMQFPVITQPGGTMKPNTLQPQRTVRTRLMPQPLRGRSATIGQVANMVPAPIQQAAARVDPNQVIRSRDSPAYLPPPNFFPGV